MPTKLQRVRIIGGTSSCLRESPSWTARDLQHPAARGPDSTRGFAGAAHAARALSAVHVELATARALALADARARALPDLTTFSNDSIVYEIVPGPDVALQPREVPPRDHTSNLPPPPGMHQGKARARGAWPSGKLQAGGGGGSGGDGGGKARAYAPDDVRNPQHPHHGGGGGGGEKAWAFAPNDVRNPRHPNHNTMKNGAPRASRRGRPPRHIRPQITAPITPATPSASVPPTTLKLSATVPPVSFSQGKQSSESSEQAISSRVSEQS
jgi:hypothetical protein